MIRESRSQEERAGDLLFPRAHAPLAVATSIDASLWASPFAFLQVDILLAVSLIGLTTFLLSAVGVKAGGRCGLPGQVLGGSWPAAWSWCSWGARSCWNIWASFHKRTKILRGARLCPSYFGISSQLCSNPGLRDHAEQQLHHIHHLGPGGRRPRGLGAGSGGKRRPWSWSYPSPYHGVPCSSPSCRSSWRRS